MVKKQRFLDKPGAKKDHPKNKELSIVSEMDSYPADPFREISKSRLQWVINNIVDIICHIDDKRIIHYVNRTVKDQLGFTPEELIGKSIIDYIHPDDFDLVVDLIRTAIQQRIAIVRIEFRFRHADGNFRWMESEIHLLFDTDEGYTGALFVSRDISERKQAGLEQEAIMKIASSLKITSNRSELIGTLLEQIMLLFPAGEVAFLKLDNESNELVIESGSDLFSGTIGKIFRPNDVPFFNTSQSDKAGIIVPTDYVLTDEILDLFFGLRHTTCSPLITRNSVIGYLIITSTMPMVESDLRILNAISDIGANAIQRIDLNEQTERHLHQLQALHIIDQAITSTLDKHFILDALLDQVMTILKVDASSVVLFNQDSEGASNSVVRGFRSSDAESTCALLGNEYSIRTPKQFQMTVKTRTENPELFAKFPDLLNEEIHSFTCVPLVSKDKLIGVLETFHRKPIKMDQESLSFQEALSTQAAIAIDNVTLFKELEYKNLEITMAYDHTIETLVFALDIRDHETEGHSKRVTGLTLQLAMEMGIQAQDLIFIRRGALLHDIGKIGIPDSILLKPGPLDDGEWKIMRLHPVHAYNMLKSIQFLKPTLDIPYCHHEKWDGTGYPQQLEGDRIPFAARIFAITDVWDALSSNRSYRKAWDRQAVLDYINAQSGKHFDPSIVKVFMHLIQK